jgi:hypothetical protein
MHVRNFHVWLTPFAILTTLALPARQTGAAPPSADVSRDANATASATTPAPAEAQSPAVELVRGAQAAASRGDVTARDELLARAVAADADYAPARWLRGEVRFRGKWLDLLEVCGMVAGDPHYAEYRRLRAETPDTLEGHVDAARWCFRNGLENEEQYHWSRVLAVAPQHEMARQRLGLKLYRGALLTDKQIAEAEARRAAAAEALAYYGPQFDALCAKVLAADAAGQESALAELSAVRDPAALPALKQAMVAAAAEAPADVVGQLALAYVAALSNVREHAATLELLNYSVFSPSDDVRAAAARALRPRPVTDYVPHLVGALRAPIDAATYSFTDERGVSTFRAKLRQVGAEADVAATRQVDIRTVPVGGGPTGEGGRQRLNRQQNANTVAVNSLAAQLKRQVFLTNLESKVLNERIRETLSRSLNLNLGENPQAYWQQWQSYNEIAYEDHPLIQLTDYDEYYPEVVTHSCFKAGTPVWTQAGPAPIEQIVPGDMVLAQHPTTGELAFKPVLQKTLGPPIETVDVRLPIETITATRGHRFWVRDRGWEMAKALEAKTLLHSLDLAQVVEAVTTGETQRCHNLVVADFHTYFVGDSRVLVHDKTCPQPTTALTPGLVETSAAATQSAIANVVD